MAVDSAGKRYSMMQMRLPWLRRVLPIPDGAGWDGVQRYVGLSLYSGLTGATPPAFTVSGYAGGTAISSDGTMGTIFLDDSTPVPTTAVYIDGFMHSQLGLRYVALWPASGEIYYRDGYARREDGAMLIATSGTPHDYVDGIALSERGEVLTSTSSVQVFRGKRGCRNNGALCVSAVT